LNQSFQQDRKHAAREDHRTAINFTRIILYHPKPYFSSRKAIYFTQSSCITQNRILALVRRFIVVIILYHENFSPKTVF
jgi:hypothetical protein